MSSLGSHRHHSIDYLEFCVADMAEAQRFYGGVFGWTFRNYGPNYAGIEGESGEVGGLCTDGKVQPGGVLVVLFSNDLESTLRAVTEAGGKIVTPPFSFPGGRRFHFEDPSGNVLAVWSLEAPPHLRHDDATD